MQPLVTLSSAIQDPVDQKSVDQDPVDVGPSAPASRSLAHGQSGNENPGYPSRESLAEIVRETLERQNAPATQSTRDHYRSAWRAVAARMAREIDSSTMGDDAPAGRSSADTRSDGDDHSGDDHSDDGRADGHLAGDRPPGEAGNGLDALDGPSPLTLVTWFLDNRALWRKSTFRNYRSSIRHLLREMAEQDLSDAQGEEIAEALGLLGRASTKGTRPRSQDPKATKKKGLDPADFQRMKAWLSLKQPEGHGLVREILYCGSLVGLRPAEWPSASVIREPGGVDADRLPEHPATAAGLPGRSSVGRQSAGSRAGGRVLLYVSRNAKATQGRGNLGYRILDITEYDTQDVEQIERLCLAARRAAEVDAWASALKRGSTILLRLHRELFSRRRQRYTLYAGRHAFAARLKAAGYSKEAIAALMGHSSPETAGRHYGKPRRNLIQDDPAALPMPSPENLAAVAARRDALATAVADQETASAQEGGRPIDADSYPAGANMAGANPADPGPGDPRHGDPGQHNPGHGDPNAAAASR